MKYKWKIEYWDSKKELTFCYNSDHCKWDKCPKRGILFVYISIWGSYPYMNPNNEYKTTLKGLDFYFLKEIKEILYFGGWNGPKKGRTTTNSPGAIYQIDKRGETKRTSITKKPKEIHHYKEGIWVEEPWASRLGLTRKRTEAKPKKCCD